MILYKVLIAKCSYSKKMLAITLDIIRLSISILQRKEATSTLTKLIGFKVLAINVHVLKINLF